MIGQKKFRGTDEMPAEIDFRGGERGRYAARFAEGVVIQRLGPAPKKKSFQTKPKKV
ncbi:MAG: hypothetical protein WBW84_06150 [Acidobacteriaceae bacterium]